MNTPPLPPLPLRLGSSPLVLLLAIVMLTSCATEPEPRYAEYRRPVQVVSRPVYVYYPDYEVYYDNVHREYVYPEGGVWVHRHEPPRRWSRELRRAPYVPMEFQDAPDRHHQDVIRRYPPHRRSDRDRRDYDRDDRDDRDDRRR